MSESAADRAKRLVADTCVPRAGHREGYETKWGNHCLDCIAAEIAAAEQAARDEAERECIKAVCFRCDIGEWPSRMPQGGGLWWEHSGFTDSDFQDRICDVWKIWERRYQRAASEEASDEDTA